MKKQLDIRKTSYALASKDGNQAEMTLYGSIYEQQPTDFWGDPVEGQFILLDEFLRDLEEIKGCKTLTIHINSYGGDAGVSNTIHNRLRELADSGCAITCVVDGVAMSGGSMIMCAADNVQVYPSSLVMIHKAWTFLFGGYNADEMRKTAEQNDAYDKMQAEIYKRKTGLSDTVLMHMMANTTYMTGREAKEKGFADEILEGESAQIAASADGRTLYVNGRTMHLCPGMFAPDTIPTVSPAEQAAAEHINPPDNPGDEEGGNSMTTEELRAQYPDQVAEIEAAARAGVDTSPAVSAERSRLAEIDEVANLFDPDLVREAKYGDTACDAKELAFRAAKAAAKQGSAFMTALGEDAKNSGAKDVGGSPAPDAQEKNTPAEKFAAGRAAAKAALNK